MVTFIISGLIVCFFSLIGKAIKATREEDTRRKAFRLYLDGLLTLEAMGFTVITHDRISTDEMETARKNRYKYNILCEPMTLAETLYLCANSPEDKGHILRSIKMAERGTGVTISPNLSDALKAFNKAETMHRDYKSDALKTYESMKEPPYYIIDQLNALDDIINGIHVNINRYQAERETAFDNLRKIQLDEKIARLKLQASKKEQEADKLRARYGIKA